MGHEGQDPRVSKPADGFNPNPKVGPKNVRGSSPPRGRGLVVG